MIFSIQYARASVCTVLYVCVGDGDDVYGGGGSVCVQYVGMIGFLLILILISNKLLQYLYK